MRSSYLIGILLSLIAAADGTVVGLLLNFKSPPSPKYTIEQLFKSRIQQSSNQKPKSPFVPEAMLYAIPNSLKKLLEKAQIKNLSKRSSVRLLEQRRVAQTKPLHQNGSVPHMPSIRPPFYAPPKTQPYCAVGNQQKAIPLTKTAPPAQSSLPSVAPTCRHPFGRAEVQQNSARANTQTG